jgi:hypothetical protein
MTAEVLIIEAVIGLSRKTLFDGVSHKFQLWARRIYYKFSHVSFVFLSFRQPWRCVTKSVLQIEANDRNKTAVGNSSEDVTAETNKMKNLALEPSR